MMKVKNGKYINTYLIIFSSYPQNIPAISCSVPVAKAQVYNRRLDIVRPSQDKFPRRQCCAVHSVSTGRKVPRWRTMVDRPGPLHRRNFPPVVPPNKNPAFVLVE